MELAMRSLVEERAYALWEEAGRPEGSALLYWLRAELELGVIPKVEEDDPVRDPAELSQDARGPAAQE